MKRTIITGIVAIGALMGGLVAAAAAEVLTMDQSAYTANEIAVMPALLDSDIAYVEVLAVVETDAPAITLATSAAEPDRPQVLALASQTHKLIPDFALSGGDGTSA